jgi:hypothetical protein
MCSTVSKDRLRDTVSHPVFAPPVSHETLSHVTRDADTHCEWAREGRSGPGYRCKPVGHALAPTSSQLVKIAILRNGLTPGGRQLRPEESTEWKATVRRPPLTRSYRIGALETFARLFGSGYLPCRLRSRHWPHLGPNHLCFRSIDLSTSGGHLTRTWASCTHALITRPKAASVAGP